MLKNAFINYGREVSIVTIFVLSLVFMVLTGFKYGMAGMLPIVFGLLFVYLPIDNLITSYKRSNTFLSRLASAQLLVNLLVGSLLTVTVFVAAWKAQFCEATVPFDGGFRCEDNFHDLFTMELSNIQTDMFDHWHIGGIWFYIPASIVVSIVVMIYLRMKRARS